MSLFGRHVRFTFRCTCFSSTLLSHSHSRRESPISPHLESISTSTSTRNSRGDRSCSKVYCASLSINQTRTFSILLPIAITKTFRVATHAAHTARYLVPLDRSDHALRLRLREARPSQGHILRDSSCRYWTMQHLPFHVLQALQRRTQEGEEGESSGARKAGEEGDEKSRESSETRHSSVSRTSNGPHSASPSPSPSLDSETPRYARPPWQQIPSGGRRRVGGMDGDAVTPTSVEDATLERPVLGPRALGAPSWQSTAKTIPSQLLGRRSEGDADVLESNSIAFATPLPGRKTSNLELDEVEHPHSYLSPSWIAR